MAKSSVAPLERCKILFQTGKLHTSGIFPTLQAIIKAEGIKGLFRGNGASVLRIIPYSSIHFGLYEYYRRIVVTAMYGHRESHHGVSPLVDLLAGSGAGATAVLVTYPLDLVRTRLAYITESGTLSGKISSNSGSSSSLKGGTTAAAATSGLRTPPLPHSPASPSSTTNLTRRSMHGIRTIPDPNHSIRGVLSSTLRLEGLRGLYHGIGPSMYGILPYAGLKFYVYQRLKQSYLAFSGIDVGGSSGRGIDSTGDSNPAKSKGKAQRLPVPAMLAFGGIAGLVAQTATYPLDVVRRRMQVEGLKSREPPIVSLGAPHFPDERLPQSTPAALVAIGRRQGWRVLYSGLSINYMKVVPSTAIGFTLYDYLKSALDLPTHL
jgi:Mitochondrial carrier protein